MEKILVSLPEELVKRMRAIIPTKQRSSVVAELVKKEVEKRENELLRCAEALESDQALNEEMAEWEEATIGDGIEDESW